jgi:regulation of enolase protein 1 (concanavalin A-like superfamily)
MFQLGNPTSLDKRGRLTGEAGTNTSITSDGTLFIKTNSNNMNWKATFYEMYPNDLGDITFSTTETQEFLTSTVTFNYTYYHMTRA